MCTDTYYKALGSKVDKHWVAYDVTWPCKFKAAVGCGRGKELPPPMQRMEATAHKDKCRYRCMHMRLVTHVTTNKEGKYKVMRGGFGQVVVRLYETTPPTQNYEHTDTPK